MINLLVLLGRVATLFTTNSRKFGSNDKAAYLAARTIAEQLEDRNSGIWSDTGFDQPINR